MKYTELDLDHEVYGLHPGLAMNLMFGFNVTFGSDLC